MRKAVNMLGWISVSFTIISLVFTLLSTYLFKNIRYFNSYFTFQCGMIFTMIFMGIKMYQLKDTSKNIFYSAFCMIIAFGTMFFMYLRVF